MARQDRCLRLLDKIDENNVEGVRDVLQYDVDLTVERKGDTPIHSASRKGSLDVLKLLIAKGGDVNLKNQSPEMSGSFMLKPYQEFEIMFKGAQPVDANVKRKIAFYQDVPVINLSEMYSVQYNYVARISLEENPTFEGTVYIHVLHNDLRDEHTGTECLAAIPFKIPEPPKMKHAEVSPKETSPKVETTKEVHHIETSPKLETTEEVHPKETSPKVETTEQVHPKETSQIVEAAAMPLNKDKRKGPRKPFIYPD